MTTVTQLPRDADGNEYGTAAQIAARLTTAARRVTAARIRDWAWRARKPHDRLYGLLPAVHVDGERTGTTWYRLRDAAHIAALTRRGADHVR